jgi:hypothetical protein
MHARKRGVQSFEKLSRGGKNKEKSMSMEKKEKKRKEKRGGSNKDMRGMN